MRFRDLTFYVLAILMLFGCDEKERVKASDENQHQGMAPQAPATAGHEVKVEEVIQAKSYTYIRVMEGNEEYWIATAKQPFEEGMVLKFDQGMEMQNFDSKELNRTFESIWFVDQMRGAAINPSRASGSVSPYGKEKQVKTQNVEVDKVSGGVTVEELFSNMISYEGKTVSIRGKVSKFNSSIMGRNWAHIQDGTSAGENFDLTVTTSEMVKTGDVVVFKGTIALNKDFGAGYTYELIMEEAVIAEES
ncbi:SH3-like domain-containing protein [bacterium]|nr:SH3-like domain-containing protein [bacterium]